MPYKVPYALQLSSFEQKTKVCKVLSHLIILHHSITHPSKFSIPNLKNKITPQEKMLTYFRSVAVEHACIDARTMHRPVNASHVGNLSSQSCDEKSNTYERHIDFQNEACIWSPTKTAFIHSI